MAHFLRAKQAGIANDFSGKVDTDSFVLDDLGRFGVSSQISRLAYDPVQSILAVGTKSSKFGAGQIYIYGKKRISATFELPRQGASVKELQFCSDRLIVLDTKHEISVLGLAERRWLCSYSAPGSVTAIASDPTLDYVILGLQTGDVLAYDIDREALAPFKVPNLWLEQNPRARAMPVVSLQFHPRDIGKLLIGYADGAAIYSFKKDEPRRFFQYHVPPGAAGGDNDPSSRGLSRLPKLTEAIWHPTGTFLLTCHADSSLVIWDPKDGRVLMARTLTETNIDKPGSAAAAAAVSLPGSGQTAPAAPLAKVAWCANQDPDDTAILIAGGTSALMPGQGLTLLELGRTPNYATATWPLLSAHFESPKRQHVLPTPAGIEVVDFCLIPRKTPWFAGAHDPIALIAVLSSGELTTLSFPSGYPISPTNQLHLSLTFVHPFVGRIAHAQLERGKWLGMSETRKSGPPLLQGGAEAPSPLRRFESRSIILTAHADGTVRMWDVGHGDQIENEDLLQADVARAVGRLENVQVIAMSLSNATSELAVGLRSGEIILFRWGRNPQLDREGPRPGPNAPGKLTNVVERRDPALAEGFHPFTLYNSDNGPCTALKVSDVGFVAAGFEGGQLVVIDMRGPAVIFSANVKELSSKEKSGPFRKKASISDRSWATTLEFSVMTLDDEGYSSILLHAGTSTGHISTLKLLPNPNGGYTVTPAGSSPGEEKALLIHPLHVHSGKPASAKPNVVGSLRNGIKVDGTLLVVTRSEARIFRPPTAKGAHKSWDNALCDCAAVTCCHDQGIALVGLFGDGTVRSYSLPGLREIGSVRIDHILDVTRLSEAVITDTGIIIGWTGPSQLARLDVWGKGNDQLKSEDGIFNPELLLPPRPTISNFQWVSGTQYITPVEMATLISGPDRPPSKRMVAQARADESARRAAALSSRPGASTDAQQEGYWAYMQRQVNERTEKLGLASDRMDHLEDNSSGWLDDVNKAVKDQKKSLMWSFAKGRMGL